MSSTPKASTTFTLLPGEQLPAVLRTPLPRTRQIPISYSSSEAIYSELHYDSLSGTCTANVTSSPGPHSQPLDDVLEGFNEALEDKMLLVRLLLRIQRTYEERELLLRRYMSKEDIERLVCERNPTKNSATVSAKYLHAVFEHNLRSNSMNRCRA